MSALDLRIEGNCACFPLGIGARRVELYVTFIYRRLTRRCVWRLCVALMPLENPTLTASRQVDEIFSGSDGPHVKDHRPQMKPSSRRTCA